MVSPFLKLHVDVCGNGEEIFRTAFNHKLMLPFTCVSSLSTIVYDRSKADIIYI